MRARESGERVVRDSSGRVMRAMRLTRGLRNYLLVVFKSESTFIDNVVLHATLVLVVVLVLVLVLVLVHYLDKH